MTVTAPVSASVSRRILVPVGGSVGSDRALDFAVGRALAMGAPLEIVTVLDPGQLDPYGGLYRTGKGALREALCGGVRSAVVGLACAPVPLVA